MLTVHQLTYNPFQENTYVVTDQNGKCAIIDPGCYTAEEKNNLKAFIDDNELTPVKLILTHSHLDHVFGTKYVANTFNLDLEIHPKDEETLLQFERTTSMYGIPNIDIPPSAITSLEEGVPVKIGEDELEVRFVPGHAPGHVVFYSKTENFVINGDCLFYGSIGRTDLPGGNHEQLLNSIRTQLFTLPDNCKVYCGHGPATTIGFEKLNNPFLQ